jgi:hypothetical protein
VVTRRSAVGDLLDRADAARAAGRGADAAGLYDEAIARCRAASDLDGWTRAVLGAASVHLFGAEPGKLPAELYDVLVRTTDHETRARVGAALARCWAYAGQPARGARFADAAADQAEAAGSPELLADCLDAALAARWGPDELDLRRSLAHRLDEVAAHVRDPETRLRAHLWGLQVACEDLDIPAIHRQIRALELLGDESPRAMFFAASRRLMLDMLRGRTDTATQLTAIATTAAKQAGLADSWMVLKAMHAYTAAFAGDAAACAAGAAETEAFALSEAVTTVGAEAAFLWVCAGQLDRARTIVQTFGGRVLDDLPRDVNWLLTLQCILEAALAVQDRDVVKAAARLLQPYQGRAVFNAGAVMFHGTTDDTLARAATLLGDTAMATRLARRALSTYERLGAKWWRDRLTAAIPTTRPDGAARNPRRRTLLKPAAGGVWLIGSEDNPTPVRALRGFIYLRLLLQHPHQPIPALNLVAAGGGVLDEADTGPILDKQARDAYRKRLHDLDEAIAQAEDWSDIGRSAALHAERDALTDQLATATGLGGRLRSSGSSHERARIAVRKAIDATIDRITGVDPVIGQHLRASIRTGSTCAYEPPPDPAVVWLVE